jgi:hypothetical protein
MTYELRDIERGNLVDAFDGEEDALVAAAELIEANTPLYAAALTLLRVGDDGSLATVAEREPLAAVAERTVADRAKRPA